MSSLMRERHMGALRECFARLGPDPAFTTHVGVCQDECAFFAEWLDATFRAPGTLARRDIVEGAAQAFEDRLVRVSRNFASPADEVLRRITECIGFYRYSRRALEWHAPSEGQCFVVGRGALAEEQRQ
jgi:hypothetical protein